MPTDHQTQLTKEDEASTGGEEIEVRREDQDKINRFSRLHQREIVLEEELKTMQVCWIIPFRNLYPFHQMLICLCLRRRTRKTSKKSLTSSNWPMKMTKSRTSPDIPRYPLSTPKADFDIAYHRYRIGDSFVSLPLPEVQELLSASTERIEHDVSAVEEKLSGIREEMQELKVALYARFGRSINLET